MFSLPRFPFKRLALPDILIASGLAAAGLMSVPFLQTQIPATVVVYRDNRIIAQYPLDEDRTFVVEGVQGGVKLHIENRRVKALASSCPRQVCTRTGALSRPGGQIVCAPNHILVEIRSRREGLPDAVTP